MTTTLDTSCSDNTMVLSARRSVSACMYFLVTSYFRSKVINYELLILILNTVYT